MSSLTLKNGEHRKYLQFSFGGWPCGTYTTECLSGTGRPRVAGGGGPGATMRRLGRGGYLALAAPEPSIRRNGWSRALAPSAI